MCVFDNAGCKISILNPIYIIYMYVCIVKGDIIERWKKNDELRHLPGVIPYACIIYAFFSSSRMCMCMRAVISIAYFT